MGVQQVSWEQMKKTYACALVQLTLMLANSWFLEKPVGVGLEFLVKSKTLWF
jgi:hypothetical protein